MDKKTGSLYTTVGATRILGCGHETIRDAVKAGMIAYERYGPYYLFSEEAILDFYHRAPVNPTLIKEHPEMLSVTQAAKILGYSRQFIREAAMKGMIPCTRYARYRMFDPQDLQNYLEKIRRHRKSSEVIGPPLLSKQVSDQLSAP